MSDVYLARLKLASLRHFIRERGVVLDPRTYPGTWTEALETCEAMDSLLFDVDRALDALPRRAS